MTLSLVSTIAFRHLIRKWEALRKIADVLENCSGLKCYKNSVLLRFDNSVTTQCCISQENLHALQLLNNNECMILPMADKDTHVDDMNQDLMSHRIVGKLVCGDAVPQKSIHFRESKRRFRSS